MKKKSILLFIAGSVLTSIGVQTASAQWKLTGNTVISSDKLGTLNPMPLKIITSDTERVRVTENGRVGIGTSAPVNILTVKSTPTLGATSASWLTGLTSPVFVGFADNASSEFVLATASNVSPRRSVIQGRRSRGTLAAPTVVANGDYLTSFLASGYDGSAFQNPATIDFFVDGVPSAGNVPARISFVTGTNQATRTERLKVGSTGNFNFNNTQLTLLQSTGNVGIGTASPGYKLDVAGRMRIKSGGGSAGTWLMNAANTSDASFVGLQDDNSVGFFGSPGAGWGLTMNLTSGNVGIGTLDPGPFKTKISHGAYGFDVEDAATTDDWELFVNGSNLNLFCNGSQRGVFNCTTGAYATVSDERLKTNIKPMPSMLQKINQLKPSTYHFKAAPGQEHNGFIAQEVMEIFPDLVMRNVNKERKLDVYTLDYSGFGVLAIKGIQELQVLLEDKDEQITVLKNELDELKNLLISKGVVSKSELVKSTPGNSLSKASLAQSIPNPSNGITTLGYYLPNEAKRASIEISSITGAVLKSYPIAQTGNGQLTINSRDFASGLYIYTLVVNGNKVASKKMIIAK